MSALHDPGPDLLDIKGEHIPMNIKTGVTDYIIGVTDYNRSHGLYSESRTIIGVTDLANYLSRNASGEPYLPVNHHPEIIQIINIIAFLKSSQNTHCSLRTCCSPFVTV